MEKGFNDYAHIFVEKIKTAGKYSEFFVGRFKDITTRIGDM